LPRYLHSFPTRRSSDLSSVTRDELNKCAILEGVVTTSNPDGSVHLSPMGPRVDWPVAHFFFRPYPGSTTCGNLERNRRGIFHVRSEEHTSELQSRENLV